MLCYGVGGVRKGMTSTGQRKPGGRCLRREGEGKGGGRVIASQNAFHQLGGQQSMSCIRCNEVSLSSARGLWVIHLS